jgi:hypothetical protein
MTAVSVAPAAGVAEDGLCHGLGWPACVGVFTFFDSDVAYQMNGSPTLASVDKFTSPSKTRNVTWSKLEMQGKTEKGDVMIATLDSSRQSSGTVLSVGNTEFPATATMRFFFKMEIGGLKLISDRPAVVQGIIHSIPPSGGDVLTLIGEPVDFHQEGEPDLKVGTLKQSSVSFNNPSGSEKSVAQAAGRTGRGRHGKVR